MCLRHEEAAIWMPRRPLAQPALAVLLAAAGCAGLRQTPKDPEDTAAGEGSRWGPWIRPQRGNLTSSSGPAWKRAICDVVLEEDHHGRRVCGPQVIIGGAMKCGTNSLGSLLQLHPRVKFHYCRDEECAPCQDNAADCMERFQGASKMGAKTLWESHYFTHLTSLHNPPRDYEGNEGRYLLARQLPRVDGVHNITVDKSPSYLDTHFLPDVATHAKRLLPHAKVIFSLCDPAARLYSEYYHNLRWDETSLYRFFDDAGVKRPANFSEWVVALQEDSELCRLQPRQCADARNNSILKGIYADGLQRWIDAFGKHEVLVVNLVDSVDQKAAKVLAHAGLPFEEYPWGQLDDMGHSYVNHIDGYKGRWYASTEAPEAMEKLRSFYSGHNARLADLLREQWPRDW